MTSKFLPTKGHVLSPSVPCPFAFGSLFGFKIKLLNIFLPSILFFQFRVENYISVIHTQMLLTYFHMLVFSPIDFFFSITINETPNLNIEIEIQTWTAKKKKNTVLWHVSLVWLYMFNLFFFFIFYMKL